MKSARRWVVATLMGATALACGSGEPGGTQGETAEARPDLLLVVLDTVRADALSSLGGPPGTTPNLDALAAEGLLYTHAFSSAPWTLPAHASLFTGLSPDRHGVGVRGRVTAREDLETLAERLAAEGYRTLGLSENPLISNTFRMAQGFERFAAPATSDSTFPLVSMLESWMSDPADTRPLFVFVNLFDAHLPYRVRPENPFLPEGVGAAEAEAVQQSPFRICDQIQSAEELAILKGLYLGEVARADAKFGEVLRTLRESGRAGPLVTVVTSDHGEHFGEKRLLVHQFSLGNRLLHVPLVVHGLPQTAPAIIDAAVQLADVTPSVLGWAGIALVPGLTGRTLPVEPGLATTERAFVAAYSDRDRVDWPEAAGAEVARIPARLRSECVDRDRAFGEMLSFTRYPHKLIWYERYPAALYDLSWDPNERSDLASVQPDRARRLVEEVREYIERTGVASIEPGAPEATPEAADALRALGYIE